MRDHRRQAQAAPTATLNSLKLQAAQSTMAAAAKPHVAPKEEQRLTNRQIRREEENNKRTMPRTLMQPTMMG